MGEILTVKRRTEVDLGHEEIVGVGCGGGVLLRGYPSRVAQARMALHESASDLPHQGGSGAVHAADEEKHVGSLGARGARIAQPRENRQGRPGRSCHIVGERGVGRDRTVRDLKIRFGTDEHG